MLIGEYQHNLDAKGRIMIPAKLRDELGQDLVITAGLDKNLLIYTAQQFDEIAKKILSLPMTDPKARKYKAHTLGKAQNSTLDAQGRILVSTSLMEAANLSKNCVFVGLYDHVELWDKATWEAYYNDASAKIDDIAQDLTEYMV